MSTSFRRGTAVETVGVNKYSACFDPDWCVGTVPHGGYVTSIFLTVAKLHFATVRASYDQPDTIAAQLTFLRRTRQGEATFSVGELKLGQRTSTIHITLTQGDDSLPLVVGYFTLSNMHTEVGVTLPTKYELHPSPSPLSSTMALRNGTEPNWVPYKSPFSKFRKAGEHLLNYLPRHDPGQMLIDQWLTMANGERFTQESLGYVVDSFPQLVESGETSKLRTEMERLGMGVKGRGNTELGTAVRSGDEKTSKNLTSSQWARFWYPTVLLNMEVKKPLPAEGVEWLFSRVKAKQIRNGRMDIELIILDEAGDLVALSNHVALIVSAERNMNRSNMGKDGDRSKL